ncbi:AAA family ATPase [Paenibacillus kobensis]|uniref:AAA family ATPase n=1 Tax=Paenibacillus kobensis TaxID=59841 RepID=UPI000FD7BD9E|nr:AAA family ATPase [Paenibacillus kobensis]
MAKARIVWFVGPAGAGKTTLAKALARRRRMAVLDMDTLLRPAAEAIMKQAGLDPSDRDSSEYKRRCRDLGYRITMDAALENAASGIDAVVIGPFTKELNDPDWVARELSAIEGQTGEFSIEAKAVFVYLPSEQHYYDRIRQRGSALDQWKLDHWDTFRASLVRREVRWRLPEGSVLYLDNSEPMTEETLDRLDRFVFGHDSGDRSDDPKEGQGR